jgi:predicted sulfurtransferase
MAAKKLTQEEIGQLKKDLLEIEDLSEKLGQNIDISKYRDIVKSADEIKILVKALRIEWKDITGDISIAAEGFRNSVSRINDQNSGLKASARAYKGLISLADELQNYQRGWADLSEKDIARIKERSSLERIRLEENQKVLETEKTSTKLNIKDLDEKINSLHRIIASREKEGKVNTKNFEILRTTENSLKNKR